MSCKLDKVLKAINEAAGEIKNSAALKQLDKLKNALTQFANSRETESKEVDYSNLKKALRMEELNSVVSRKERVMPREYYNTINRAVKTVLGSKVTTSEELAFVGATIDNLATVGGRYAKGKVTLSKKPRKEKLEAQAAGMLQEWYESKSPYAIEYQQMSDVELLEALEKDEKYQELYKEVIPVLKEELIEQFGKINGMHTLAHELVHVGSVEYIKNNPNSDLTKRVNELYKEALSKKEKILELMGKGKNEYWTTSVEEFIAEGLSNPDMVYALSNVTSEVDGKKTVGIFRELVKALVEMVTGNKDTVYEYLLDGYYAMLESNPRTDKVESKVMDYVSRTLVMKKAGVFTPEIAKEMEGCR